MIITHVLESLSPNGGGLPAAVKEIAYQQSLLGYDVHIVCIVKHSFNKVSEGIKLNSINVFDSEQYKKHLECSRVDIIHIHGIWNIQALQLLYLAKKHGAKTIISCHGQLMPALLNSDGFLKRIKKKFYVHTILSFFYRYIDVVHSVCKQEELTLKQIFYRARHVSIYNYIDSLLFKNKVELFSPVAWESSRYVTFLGRIEARKGLENFIKSFSVYARNVTNTKIKIKIVGPVDDESFSSLLSDIISENNLDNKVLMQGPVYGLDKIGVMEASSFICLPSFSEVVGLVNIEGALMRRVVITTPNANIPEIGENGGCIIENNIDSFYNIFSWIDNLEYNEYAKRATSLYEWALRDFSKEKITQQWISLFSEFK